MNDAHNQGKLALTGLDDTLDADPPERYPIANRLFDDTA